MPGNCSLESIYYHPTEHGKRKRELLNLPRDTIQSVAAAYQNNFGNVVHYGNHNTMARYNLPGKSGTEVSKKWFQDGQGALQLHGYINNPLVDVSQLVQHPANQGVNAFAGSGGSIRNIISKVGSQLPFPKVSELQGQFGDSLVGLYPFNMTLKPNDPLSIQFARKLFDPNNSQMAKQNRLTQQQGASKTVQDDLKRRGQYVYGETDAVMAENAKKQFEAVQGADKDWAKAPGKGGIGPVRPPINWNRRGDDDDDEGGDEGSGGGGASASGGSSAAEPGPFSEPNIVSGSDASINSGYSGNSSYMADSLGNPYVSYSSSKYATWDEAAGPGFELKKVLDRMKKGSGYDDILFGKDPAFKLTSSKLSEAQEQGNNGKTVEQNLPSIPGPIRHETFLSEEFQASSTGLTKDQEEGGYEAPVQPLHQLPPHAIEEMKRLKEAKQFSKAELDSHKGEAIHKIRELSLKRAMEIGDDPTPKVSERYWEEFNDSVEVYDDPPEAPTLVSTLYSKLKAEHQKELIKLRYRQQQEFEGMRNVTPNPKAQAERRAFLSKKHADEERRFYKEFNAYAASVNNGNTMNINNIRVSTNENVASESILGRRGRNLNNLNAELEGTKKTRTNKKNQWIGPPERPKTFEIKRYRPMGKN
jgi:hypothetical protein